MKSRPQWVYFYNNLLEEYIKVLDHCADYYENHLFIEFLKKLKENDMFFYVVGLKNKIQDSKLLSQINQFKKEV